MSQRDKYRILIVEDHPMVRERLTEVINAEPDLLVCGEAESAPQAVTAVEMTKPDLVLVDLSLRESHGLDLIKNLRALDPKLAVLVVSMHEESLYGERCLRAGARGYMTKQQATRDVLIAIRRVLAGEWYCSPQLTARLTALGLGEQLFVTDPMRLLSDRELQVYQLLGQGLHTKEIGDTLKLDPSTIETHRRRIRAKLGLPTTTALIFNAFTSTQDTRTRCPASTPDQPA